MAQAANLLLEAIVLLDETRPAETLIRIATAHAQLALEILSETVNTTDTPSPGINNSLL